MILPIGHQDSKTRRAPWVTLVFIVACLAAWIANLAVVSELDRLPPEHYQRAADDYWKARPYLEPDERLAYYMLLQERPDAQREGPDRQELTMEDWELWLFNERHGEKGKPPADAAQVVEEQAELDRLVVFGFYLEPGQIPPEEEVPNQTYGLVPAKAAPHTFLSYMFMHGSWAHIFGNLFLLFLVGPALEDRWGRPLYALFYLTAGAFAGAFYFVLSMDSPIPMVGASGAVSGALGAFLVLYWSTRIQFFYYFFPLRPLWGTFLVPAWVALPLWFANEAASLWLSHSGAVQSHVAYGAHVGGFLFGVLFAVSIRGLRLEERLLRAQIDRKVTIAGTKDSLAQTRDWLDKGRIDDALALAETLAEAQPDNLEVLLAKLEVGHAAYQPDVGAGEVAAWIRGRVAKGKLRDAATAWVRAVGCSPAFDLDPTLLLQLAAEIRKAGARDDAVRALRYVLSDVHDALRAGVLFRTAELAHGLDAATERRALVRSLALPDLPGPKRERLEEAVRSLRAADDTPCPDPLAEARWHENRGGVVEEDGAIALELDEDEGADPSLSVSRFGTER